MWKKIIVACGGAVATSSMIAERLTEFCEENGIRVEIVQCRLSEIASNLYNVDLIVPSSRVRRDYGVPLVVGMPFISGIGIEKTKAQILEILQKES